ncbi:hypothetical protein SAMN04489712_13739 [Thermomonospora echinospora]|uniref:DUF4333 domain-containing protein n=1 Tax=Thermomonospora echinospora TaxID=1992 RepID=A0A1H6E646_9ACTN|nr:hypothetical protein [Thermomonospora echinospora]SEG93190.1 hypothetical protein SAMN04489712_13739 [Thermomonospora echinospora]
MKSLDGVRAKVLIGAVAAVVLVVSGTIAYLVFSDRRELRHETQVALRTAMPALATAELRSRGHALNGPLKCADMAGWTKRKMRVRCAGTTTDHKPVEVIGAAEHVGKQEFFTILVDGRPVVQNVPCLGSDCRTEN